MAAPAAREIRFIFPVIQKPSPPPTVDLFTERAVRISCMHGEPLRTLLFVSGIRKFSTSVSPPYPIAVAGRMVQLQFTCSQSVPEVNAPDTFAVISICRKPSVLPASEFHPPRLFFLLKCGDSYPKVTPDVGLYEPGKPYPVLPFQLSASLLKANNTITIYWSDSSVEETALDYCLFIYMAKRKSTPAIIDSIGASVLTVADSLIQEQERESDDDIAANSRTLPLTCPVSRQRLVLPVRSKQCRHLECFEPANFLAMNAGPTPRYLCPICNQIVLPVDLVVDQFIQELLFFFPQQDRVELFPNKSGITAREHAVHTGGRFDVVRASRKPEPPVRSNMNMPDRSNDESDDNMDSSTDSIQFL